MDEGLSVRETPRARANIRRSCLRVEQNGLPTRGPSRAAFEAPHDSSFAASCRMFGDVSPLVTRLTQALRCRPVRVGRPPRLAVFVPGASGKRT